MPWLTKPICSDKLMLDQFSGKFALSLLSTRHHRINREQMSRANCWMKQVKLRGYATTRFTRNRHTGHYSLYKNIIKKIALT